MMAQRLMQSSCGFYPTKDKVLVKKSPREELKSKDGLYIPDIWTRQPITGIVVGIGPGKITKKGIIPVTIKLGTKVQFPDYVGHAIKINGEDHILIVEDDIVCAIDD